MVTFRSVRQWWRQTHDVARLCLATGACALLVALLGALVNLLVGNWFQSTGMAIVGLFYLVLGICSWPPRGANVLGAAEALSRERETEPAR